MARRNPGKASRNERRKVTAALANGVAGAILIVGAVQPIFGPPGSELDWLRMLLAISAGFRPHLGALGVVRGVED